MPCYVQSVLFVADMDKRQKVSIVAAALLAGAAASYYVAVVRPDQREAAIRMRGALEDCLKAARMIYDVHWAAACQKQADQSPSGLADGHAECELPDAQAAVVNRWLNDAEKRCMAEARSD